MAAQSGIAPTPELTTEWSNFLANSNERLFKISIKDEQLHSDGTWYLDGQENTPERVFDLFSQERVAQDNVPSYFVIRTSPPTSSSSSSPSLVFISYVPDHSPVRSKMLYASTRTTLIRHLGDSNFIDSIFATSKDDLSYSSYLAHTRHSSAAAPLTAREQEMAEIRAVESLAAREDSSNQELERGGRSMIFGQQESKLEEGTSEVRGALPWSQEAKETVRELNGGEKEIVQLEIDLKTETIVLSEPQPTSLSVPTDKPCYLFYRHPAGIVLIYSCPPKSPIKSRLVYSSAVLVFYKYAAKEYAGVEVLKKLETDDPSEVTREWIDSELGPLATTGAQNKSQEGNDTGASTPVGGGGGGGSAPLPREDKAGFARPSRPGRKR
ncbi:hypothetical protein JCM16303_005406 [Sporobolomyces ruberrimus]